MTFRKARNGSAICAVASIPFHSAYNPIKEAERFVAALHAPFNPHFVVIMEPALSYTAHFLRQKFPMARLFAVRYCHDFAVQDALWDGTFYADTADVATLMTALYNTLGEEGLFSAFFCAWPPSARAFPAIDAIAWSAIHEAVSLSRDVLATRSKFAERWVLNAFALSVRMKQAAGVERGNAPIVIAASGASLERALPRLKERRGEYFLIALSSALLPLHTAGIQCDLCMTTDGGFYAGSHLSPYMCGVTSPLAIAAEGKCPAALLERCTIIPLVYPDGPASELLRRTAPRAVTMAERNGTVSGTALCWARQLTSGNVYFCGLDMAGGEGRQHCPPNALEAARQSADTRLCTTEGRTTAARFASTSLEIYRKWFAALDITDLGKNDASVMAGGATLSNRDDYCNEANNVRTVSDGGGGAVYRLSDGYQYANTLGNISDEGFDHFYECLDECRGGSLPRIVERPLPSREERRQIALDFVQSEGGTAQWLHEIFPADCIACERITGDKEQDEAERARHEASLQEKNNILIGKIYRILQDSSSSQDAGRNHAEAD